MPEIEQEMRGIRDIIRKANKYPLLSREQEVDWIYLFQQSTHLIYWCYRRSLPTSPFLLDAWKVRKEAQDLLVLCNLKLVIKMARGLWGRGLEISELVPEGVTGIIRSVEKFDPGKKCKLSTSATRWVFQRMNRALEDQSRIIRLTANVIAKITRLQKIYRAFVLREGRDPSSTELSEEFLRVHQEIVSPEECEELGRQKEWHKGITSLDAPLQGGDEDSCQGDYIECDEKWLPEERIEQRADRVFLRDVLINRLPELRDRKLLLLKYGFLDGKAKTDREIATIFGLKSIKQVKDWESRVIQDLKSLSSVEELSDPRLRSVLIEEIEDPLEAYQSIRHKVPCSPSTFLGIPPFLLVQNIPHDQAIEIATTLTYKGCIARVTE
jgi:RNA polymerase sigma factor (sigma-70 family)